MTDIIMKHVDNSDSNDNMETFKVHTYYEFIRAREHDLKFELADDYYYDKYTVFYSYHVKGEPDNVHKVGMTSLTDKWLHDNGYHYGINGIIDDHIHNKYGYICGRNIEYRNPITGSIEQTPLVLARVYDRLSEYLKTSGLIHHVDDIMYGLAYGERIDSNGNKTPVWFTDYMIHDMLLTNANIKRLDDPDEYPLAAREKFLCTQDDVKQAITAIINDDSSMNTIGGSLITLRPKQEECVKRAMSALRKNGKFLMFALPRFGKTFTAMAILHEIQNEINKQSKKNNVNTHGVRAVIVTNQPVVAKEWWNACCYDYNGHGSSFTSKEIADAFKCNSDYVKTYLQGSNHKTARAYDLDEWLNEPHDDSEPAIVFISLQDYKQTLNDDKKTVDNQPSLFNDNDSNDGNVYKERTMKLMTLHWDALFCDEAHEAMRTWKTVSALNGLTADYNIELSGTAYEIQTEYSTDEKFVYDMDDEYDDMMLGLELQAQGKPNPYADLVLMQTLTWDYASMMAKAIDMPDDEFSFNEFMSVIPDENNEPVFKYNDAVIKFLAALFGRQQTINELMGINNVDIMMPFDRNMRRTIQNSMWFMDSVDSCNAMETLLTNTQNTMLRNVIPDNICVINAAGNDGRDAIIEIEREIRKNKKEHSDRMIIILSAARFKEGITIPELNGVMWLKGGKAGSAMSINEYMQGSMRVKSPCSDLNGYGLKKTTGYVIDPNPMRAIAIRTRAAFESADSKGISDADAVEFVNKSLSCNPIIQMSDDGSMKSMDFRTVFNAINRQITEMAYEHCGSTMKLFDLDSLKTALSNGSVSITSEQREIMNEMGYAYDNKKKAAVKTAIELFDRQNQQEPDSDNDDSDKPETIIEQTLFGDEEVPVQTGKKQKKPKTAEQLEKETEQKERNNAIKIIEMIIKSFNACIIPMIACDMLTDDSSAFLNKKPTVRTGDKVKSDEVNIWLALPMDLKKIFIGDEILNRLNKQNENAVIKIDIDEQIDNIAYIIEAAAGDGTRIDSWLDKEISNLKTIHDCTDSIESHGKRIELLERFNKINDYPMTKPHVVDYVLGHTVGIENSFDEKFRQLKNNETIFMNGDENHNIDWRNTDNDYLMIADKDAGSFSLETAFTVWKQSHEEDEIARKALESAGIEESRINMMLAADNHGLSWEQACSHVYAIAVDEKTMVLGHAIIPDVNWLDGSELSCIIGKKKYDGVKGIMNALETVKSGDNTLSNDEKQVLIRYALHPLTANERNDDESWSDCVLERYHDVMGIIADTNRKPAERLKSLRSLIASVHDDDMSMFTACFSNPPYQGSGTNDIPYPPLYRVSRCVSHHVVMVCPNKWRYFGMNNDSFMKNDKRIVSIDDYPEDGTGLIRLFPMVSISSVNIIHADDSYDNVVNTDNNGNKSGGVMMKYCGKITDEHRDLSVIAWSDTESAHIVQNMRIWMESIHIPSAKNMVCGWNPFGVRSYIITDEKRYGHESINDSYFNGSTKYYSVNKRGFVYISSGQIFEDRCYERSSQVDWSNEYKIAFPHTGSYRIWRDSKLLGVDEYFVDDLICAHFDDERHARGYQSYLKTRFYRVLIEFSSPKGSQDAFASVHSLVPDLSTIMNPRTGKTGYDSDWTDEDLFALFTLNPIKQAVVNGDENPLDAAILTVDDWRHIIEITKAADNKGERMLASGEITVPYEIADHIDELEAKVQALITL